jgi:hypothetical protein
MKKFINGCAGIVAGLGILVFITYECKREKQPPPPKIAPEYTAPRENHERLDHHALPLLKDRYVAVVKHGDTIITWNKWKGEWRKTYYAERKRLGNSAYSTYKVYNENLNMIQESEQFQNGMIMGWQAEYDDMGKLVKTYDADKDFNFTIDDLIKKIKEEYNVDLTKQLPEGQWAKRYRVSSSPLAKYTLMIESNGKKWHLEIDGDGGFNRHRNQM